MHPRPFKDFLNFPLMDFFDMTSSVIDRLGDDDADDDDDDIIFISV